MQGSGERLDDAYEPEPKPRTETAVLSSSMPKIEYHPFVRHIRGAVGRVVFKLGPNGQPIVTRAPSMDGIVASPQQRGQQERMVTARARYYALKANPTLLADYTARARLLGLTAWLLICKEALSGNRSGTEAPVVLALEEPGRDGGDSD